MIIFFKGVGCLMVTLIAFSLFSMKCPRGDKAMSGLASAAVATFLIEAIYKYIGGDFLGVAFLENVGNASGSLGGVASAALVFMTMGGNPVFAVTAGVAVLEFGILPGFIAGYFTYFLLRIIEEKLPPGVNLIAGALTAAAAARLITVFTDPGVTTVINTIGSSIMIATEQSPIIMGFVLGGIMKMICTSPLSSMALTAMLTLTDLPMGIAAIACFGGSFTNGLIFKNLRLGGKGSVAAVMMEPLTQADIITKNAVPIYTSNFVGGGLSGVVAAALQLVNNAPGTASPIPGMLAPFAFNPPEKVLMALFLAAICGSAAGIIGSFVYTKTKPGRRLREKTCKR